MKPLFFLPLFAAAGLLVLALSSLAADDPAAKAPTPVRQAWEHLALTQTSAFPGRPDGFARKINDLGRDGWELVCVSPITMEGKTTANIYYFKRPL